MEKAAEEELTEKKQDLIEHFVKSLKLTGENKNDNENRVRGLFRDMVKHFEAGVTAEVKTPLIEKPREPEENDDEQTIADLKRQLKLYQQKEHIDQVNQKLFSIQKEYLQLDIPNINNNEQ